MGLQELSPIEKDGLRLIIQDLKFLFEIEEIKASEIDDCLSNLKSPEAKAFIKNLQSGTKPETSLREEFFAGQSILSKYLFSDKNPEVIMGRGFIDYKIFSGNRFALMELKPLFEVDSRKSSAGRELVKIKQQELKWEDHKDQILKYVKDGGEYVVITDLKDWYFFDENVTVKDCKPFYHVNFLTFEKDFAPVENFYRVIERYNLEIMREDLSKFFFADLEIWLEKLKEIDFNVDEKEKVAFVIGIINKFIFIQTLDDYSVIEFRWLQKRWKNAEGLWEGRKLEVLKQFFDDVIKWFFSYYDTELFTVNEIQFLNTDKKNVEKFYSTFKTALGLSYLETGIGGQRGIMQYKFKFIDEDIFGKAYETYLAKIRHDEGIYYTPQYITQFIVNSTVGKIFDSKVDKFKRFLKEEKFDESAEVLTELTNIKVLDPACGSGSFLIKTVRIIWGKYIELKKVIDELLAKHDVYDGLMRDKKIEEKVAKIRKLKTILGFETTRQLISRLLLRHIFANDADNRAVAVTKLNLWLTAIKQSPRDFRFDKLPSDTNRILPYLDMNIVNGDAVIGLPQEVIINHLDNNHKQELQKLTKLRETYLSCPTDPGIVNEILKIKKEIRMFLLKKYSDYWEKEGFSNVKDLTKPLFWPLEFWFSYFSGTTPLKEDLGGFDIIVGNPPYVRIQVLSKKSPNYVEILNKSGFKSTMKNYDLALVFIEKGYNLLKKGAELGYISTAKFITMDYGEGLRCLLSENKSVKKIIDFGDQQVFDDASTYTAIIFVTQYPNTTLKYALVKKLDHDINQLELIQENINLENKELFITELDENALGCEPWVFTSDKDAKIINLLDKFPKFNLVREDVFQGLTTSADKVYLLELISETDSHYKVFSKAKNKEYLLEKQFLKPVLKGSEVKKWYVKGHKNLVLFPFTVVKNNVTLVESKILENKFPRTWEYLSECKNLLNERKFPKGKNELPTWYDYVYRKNVEKYEQPKILTQVLARKSSFALDEKGKYYFVGGGNAGCYGVLLKDKNTSLKYACGLLNSSLLEWSLKKGPVSKFQRGYFSYAKHTQDRFPFISPNKDNKKLVQEIESLVQEIYELKISEELLYLIWEEWSDKLKDNVRTIEEILDSEESYMKNGESNYCLFESVSFLLSQKDKKLNKEFEEIKVKGNIVNSTIEIFGIDENDYELVYSLSFKDKMLLDHFYISLQNTLNSRLKINTLQDLFVKTNIPVLQPDIGKKTPNLIKKVKEEFHKKSTTKYTSIVEIENKILENEIRIDAFVFQLFGMSEEDSIFVLRSLHLSESYIDQVSKLMQTD